MRRLFRKAIKVRLEADIGLKINALERKSPYSLIESMRQREGG
jgi:hypothetical protein